MRTEVIALHEGDRPFGKDSKAGAEFFPNCAHINIVGDTPASLITPITYEIPGIYDKMDKGITFNLYSKYSSYPIPGPPMYNDKSQAGGSPVMVSSQENNTTIPTINNGNKPNRKPCIKKRRLRHTY
ncbi:hypothetical protein LPJ71_001053 [Coemansia sp. S17]|nr:hypothetical protein LPJ71_001053 [Coemansia sp. S17]